MPPLSYVVDAMRQVMHGGSLERVWVDLGVLPAWPLGVGATAAIGVTRMTHFRTLRDLQPARRRILCQVSDTCVQSSARSVV